MILPNTKIKDSPFQYLLRPKSGGVLAVLQALGDQLDAILDMTIIYPGIQSPGLKDLTYGRIPRIRVEIDQLSLGENGVPTMEQIRSREGGLHIRKWLNERWIRKENLIRQYLEEQGEQDNSTFLENQTPVLDPV